jgi:hypothetical protein
LLVSEIFLEPTVRIWFTIEGLHLDEPSSLVVMRRVQTRLWEVEPHVIRLKAAELEAEDRRIANFVEFVAEGRGSRTLAEALPASERKRDGLKTDLELLRKAQNAVHGVPRGSG